MNRSERRRRRKLSRHATRDEIFPGEHGPVQQEIADKLTRVMRVLHSAFGPGYDLTLFVAEREAAAGGERMPRFNYISTAERADMLAVLDAFVAKHRAAAGKLDKINSAPPTETAQ